jgi:EmrB/QacA subfamily drug resistance transporter
VVRPERWKLLALCLATFMLLLDITIVQAALPAIQRQLGGGLSGLQWTVDAYTLPLAALIISLGTVADRFGRRTIFLGGVALFSAASLACGLSQSMAALDICRAAQGAGGAAMFATTLALVGQEFPGPARGRAILLWGSTVGAAVACGPLLGGLLTQYATWQWIFFVNVPIGVLTAAMTLRYVGNGRDETRRRLDVPGLVTLTAALVLLTGGLLRGSASSWASSAATASAAAGAVLLAGFAVLQRRPSAMLDRRLIRDRSVAAVSIATITLGAGMFAVILYLTIFLQGALSLSPLAGGLRLLPVTAPVFLVPLLLRRARISPVSGPLIGAGLATIAAGLVTMTWAQAGAPWLRLLPGLLLAGVGVGVANAAIAATALAVVPPNRAGLAAGLSNTCRLGGIAVGIAALGAVFRAGISSQVSSAHGYDTAGFVAAGHLGLAARQLGGGLVQAQTAFSYGLHLLLATAALTAIAGAAAAFRYIRVGTPPRPAARATPAGSSPRWEA